MKTVLAEIQALERKIAETYESYKKKHPATKKTRNDPMFTKGNGAAKKSPSKFFNHKQPYALAVISDDALIQLSRESGMTGSKYDELRDEFADGFESYMENLVKKNPALKKQILDEHSDMRSSIRDHALAFGKEWLKKRQ